MRFTQIYNAFNTHAFNALKSITLLFIFCLLVPFKKVRVSLFD